MADDELVAAEPGDTHQRLVGLAVDLGTTKIAVFLVDLTFNCSAFSTGAILVFDLLRIPFYIL